MRVRQSVPHCQHSDPCFRPDSLRKPKRLRLVAHDDNESAIGLRNSICHPALGRGRTMTSVECTPSSVSMSFWVCRLVGVSGCQPMSGFAAPRLKRSDFPSVRSAGQVPDHGGFAVWNGGEHRLAWATPSGLTLRRDRRTGTRLWPLNSMCLANGRHGAFENRLYAGR